MTAGSILSHHSESVRSTNFPASIICWVPIVVISGISPAANFVCRAEVPSFWNSCSTFTLSLSALKRSTASLYQSTISTLPLKNLTVTGSPAASELSPEEPAALSPVVPVSLWPQAAKAIVIAPASSAAQMRFPR